MHSMHAVRMHTRMLFLPSSRRRRSVAERAISTMVRMNDPKQMVPNEGPSALASAPPTAPEKSFVPAGAKYHWHIVPPMTYMRVSSAALVTQSSETIARVMYSGTHESTANPQQSVGSPAKSEHAFVAASRDSVRRDGVAPPRAGGVAR